MARPKVVITGGAGFIGSNVAVALVREADVVAVDHLKAGKRANLEGALKSGATLRKQDLLRGDLGPLFRGANLVYHFAANPDVRLGREGTKPLIDENILATIASSRRAVRRRCRRWCSRRPRRSTARHPSSRRRRTMRRWSRFPSTARRSSRTRPSYPRMRTRSGCRPSSSAWRTWSAA